MKAGSARVWALRELGEPGGLGPIVATVRGGSMRPVLSDGDRVEIEGRRVYLPGDVVAFAGEGGIVLHRLLGYRLFAGRVAAVIQGDAARLPDAPVALDRLLGRWRERVPLSARLQAAGRYLRWLFGRLRRER